MMKRLTVCFLLVYVAMSSAGLHAEWVMRDGRLVEVEGRASYSPEEHYNRGVNAWACEDWREAVRQFRIVSSNFPCHPLVADLYYYIGVAYYHLEEYDFANEELTNYLKAHYSPPHLEEVVELKFCIAEAFRCGARRRMFGSRRFPKWMNGEDLALTLYDEVVSALPCHEIAAKALYSKGSLLSQQCDFLCAIDAYQTLLRRFPDHDFAVEAYLGIIRTYHRQAWYEYQNPDILPLAEIAFRRFSEEFPNEERLADAAEELLEIKEIYAQGMYETGRFFERTCEPQAAVLYYLSAINDFPETYMAQCAQDRLEALIQCYPCLDIPTCCIDEAPLDSFDGDSGEYFEDAMEGL